MYCTRCSSDVPDFLWVGKDHPVLLEHPTTIEMVCFPDKPDEAKVIAIAYIKVENCSDVFKVVMD